LFIAKIIIRFCYRLQPPCLQRLLNLALREITVSRARGKRGRCLFTELYLLSANQHRYLERENQTRKSWPTSGLSGKVNTDEVENTEVNCATSTGLWWRYPCLVNVIHR